MDIFNISQNFIDQAKLDSPSLELNSICAVSSKRLYFQGHTSAVGQIAKQSISNGVERIFQLSAIGQSSSRAFERDTSLLRSWTDSRTIFSITILTVTVEVDLISLLGRNVLAMTCGNRRRSNDATIDTFASRIDSLWLRLYRAGVATIRTAALPVLTFFETLPAALVKCVQYTTEEKAYPRLMAGCSK